jgi:hypothetical protein
VTATDTDNRSGSDTVDVYANIPIIPIRIELTWDTSGTDVDSHFIAPGYNMWDLFGDCYFGNMNPDWDDSGGISTGDPQLDIDDTDGYGPEYTVLQAPPFNGIYQFKVDYFSGSIPTTATVRIWINDVLTFTDSAVLPSYGYVWDCACISWPSGTVSAGPCVTPTTLTITYDGSCPAYYCPIIVSYDGGGGTVSPGDPPTEFTGIVPGTLVTLSINWDSCDGSPYSWTLDGVPQGYIPEVWQITMNANHTVEAMCGGQYYVEG